MIKKISGNFYDNMNDWSIMIEKKLNEIIQVVNELKTERDEEKKIENKQW